MNLRIISACAALLLPAAAQDATDKPGAPPPGNPPAAAEDPAALPKANAGEEAAVRALLGQKAVISGDVTETFASEKGITFLTMEGGKFTVVCWKDSYSKFEGGSPAKLYKGKRIEITGKVEEYRKKAGDATTLQIKLREPSQIKISGDASTGEQTRPGKKDDGKKDDGKKDAKKEDGKKEERTSPRKSSRD